MTDYPVKITLEEAARFAGMSRSAAYRAAAKGQVPTVTFARRLRAATTMLLSMLWLDGDQAVDLTEGRVRRLVGGETEEVA